VDFKKKQLTNFGIDVEKKALLQFKKCVSNDYVVKASLMPDAHTGFVAPIGSVFATKEKIVPSWVGYDIGCGVVACRFKSKNLFTNLECKKVEIFNEVCKRIPMGVAKYRKENEVLKNSKDEFYKLLNELSDNVDNVNNKEILRYIKNNGLKQLGTLGSGNHFIEVGYIDDGKKNNDEIWLVIHSGSRNLGHRITTNFIKVASKDCIDYDSKDGCEYLIFQEFALKFAFLNRLEMVLVIRNVLSEILSIPNLKFEVWANKSHNHCIVEDDLLVHRKGATSSEKGERGIIPGNMRDGSYLVKGKGCGKFLMSSSHGAGRKYGRSLAKKIILFENFKKQMDGILCFSDERFVDESPDVYKNINDVLDVQNESIKVISHIRPVMNWKGSS
jgi:tRNA-splicing ligase RtcB (3'-phosphate/5'-hydroxy nucleic acid ligase)